MLPTLTFLLCPSFRCHTVEITVTRRSGGEMKKKKKGESETQQKVKGANPTTINP